MGIFNLFKPDVEKLERNKNVKGLVQIMMHKKGSIKEQAARALDKIGWKPSNLIEKVHYVIAKGEEDEKDVCMQTMIILSEFKPDNKEKVSALADLVIKLFEMVESNPSDGCAQFCIGMICVMDNDWDGAIKHFELAIQHGSTKWYREEARKFLHIAQTNKMGKVDNEKISDKSLKKIYKCVRCKKEFESNDDIIEYPDNQLVCKQCDVELERGVMQDFKFVTHIR